MYPMISNCNYESDDDLTIHRARLAAEAGTASQDLEDALDALEETLEMELSENGEYRNGAESEQACEDAERAVRETYRAARED